MIHISQAALEQVTKIFDRRKAAVGLSGYTVGALLDQGSMSNVYRIVDQSGNTDYVLRVSEEHKSSYSNDIFNVREMEILRELKKSSQPHVVQYLDAFAIDIPGQPRYYCAVMKFLRTLKQYRVDGDGVEIAVRLGVDFLPLLQSFMEKEIIHRDIKPANIFYDDDFRNDTGFLLGDFGIAKHDTNTTFTATGTETTMAPEVRGLDRSLGKDRTYSDMYSLGIVMYRYLNQGVYPANRERIDKMPPDTKPFPEPRYGSKRLRQLVLKATSYRPADRFASPQDMLRELQQCEEYREFILHETYDENATVDASAALTEENNRLRRELEQLRSQVNTNSGQLIAPKQVQPAQPQRAVINKPVTPILKDSEPRPATPSAKPATVKRTPLIVTIAVALMVIVGGIWAASTLSDNSTSSGNFTGSDSSTSNVKSLSELDSISKGDHFTFGNYPQGENGEVEPIEWRVLKVDGDKALVISEKLLDCVEYNEEDTAVTWETCTLRKWMNGEFINKAFSSSEQAKIATVTNQNPDNPICGTEGGNATQDRIFALSIEEANQYFSDDDDRMAAPTGYAKKHGAWVSDNLSLPSGEGTGWWWLRSPGYDCDYAALVNTNGNVPRYGDGANDIEGSVRPAFWLNLS